MADPDADGDDEFEENPDYYSILNVRKEADNEEIKLAYRRMCVMYHPDKHPELKDKQIAETIFGRVNKAYNVLSTPEQRMIYDIYGQKGLDAGWAVIERKRSPQEIREEYERLQKEAEERRIEQRTNPSGSITLRIDATELFTNSETDDPFYEDERGWLPNIEVRGMSINQTIEAPLTKDNTAIMSGSLNHRNGNGSGQVNVVLRRVLSPRSWGEFELGAGDGPSLRVKAFRNINKKMFGTVSLTSMIKQSMLSAGLQAMVARQLSKQTMGYLSWTGGFMSTMTSTVIRNTENYNAMAQLQLGVPNSFGLVSYTHKFGTNTKVKFALRCGMLGFVFDYGCEHKITALSHLGATMSVGQLSGVTLKLKIRRHTQTFNFPILLCEVISPSAVFYGTITPIIFYVTVKALVVAPFLRQQANKNQEELREKYASLIAEKRKEAEAAIHLMLGTHERAVEQEQEKHGLVIVNAWYGHFSPNADNLADMTSPYVTNVIIPTQCLVKDSKLILTESTKSQLNGYYDPCIGEEKYLQIRYEFRNAVHQATFRDNENVRIPKQSHKISSKVS